MVSDKQTDLAVISWQNAQFMGECRDNRAKRKSRRCGKS
jgi:hypothetical protein